jgi:hypothetical protein
LIEVKQLQVKSLLKRRVKNLQERTCLKSVSVFFVIKLNKKSINAGKILR